MDENNKLKLTTAWCQAIANPRRKTSEVRIGNLTIGGNNPIAVQSMTDCDTNDTDTCLEQIYKIRAAGGHIIRLTTQGVRETESLGIIATAARNKFSDISLVADVHFQPQVAFFAADHADKVRINPGNYNDKGGDFKALLEKCRTRNVALRIGVNHGSLSDKMVSLYGDTPQGMVESAMEFLRICHIEKFHQVVISMKSSNTRIMVHAYRMLVAAMHYENLHFPIHLGVTEAGNGMEGRIKSSVGIGALLCDGIGDTIRVSLTESPENEIPTAQLLVNYFTERTSLCSTALPFNPFEYTRRQSNIVGRMGNNNLPMTYSELNNEELEALTRGEVAHIEATTSNPVAEWRNMIAQMDNANDHRPIILYRKYNETDPTTLAIKAAADFGVMFIDGIADGIHIKNYSDIDSHTIDSISLDILQASRARMSKTEFIACPGCGRTLYNLHDTLNTIKQRLSHLKTLKIGVMGCIVNGPGEMADADYGYVGGSPGHISLYRGRELMRRNIPQDKALDTLIELIRADGRWIDAL